MNPFRRGPRRFEIVGPECAFLCPRTVIREEARLSATSMGIHTQARHSAMTKEELDKKVDEFLKAELEDPEVQEMLVSLEGD